MFQFNIVIYMALMCAASCDPLKKSQKNHPPAAPAVKPPLNKSQKNHTPAAPAVKPPLNKSQKNHTPAVPAMESPLIVLVNGLTTNPDTFSKLVSFLETNFPDADVVELKSPSWMQSVLASIPQQADYAYHELRQKISNLSKRPTLLIGYSQGGPRAYMMYKQYKNQLNVQGIITVAGALAGVNLSDVVRKIPPLVQELSLISIIKSKIMKKAQLVSSLPPGPRKESVAILEFLEQSGIADEMRNHHWTDDQELENCLMQLFIMIIPELPGIKDLIAGSDLLRSLQDVMDQLTIPTLAIGSKDDDVLSLHSQLALHILRTPNITRKMVKGVDHMDIITDREVFQEVKKFAQNILYASASHQSAA